MTGAVIIGIAAIWLAIGLFSAWFMGRRGHAPYAWGVIGTVFGPLVVLLAIDAIRHERGVSSRVLAVGEPGSGPIDVLVGVDGSEQSVRAAETAVAIAGNRMGRLTLATVIDYDLAETDRPREEREVAEQRVAAVARRLGSAHPGTAIFAGRPAAVLAEQAKKGGYELLVVGSRGRGLSELMLGSVARQLASNSDVPVLIVGDQAAVRSGLEDPFAGARSAPVS